MKRLLLLLFVAWSMFNVQCSMFNVQWSMFNGQCSMVFAENRVKKLLIRADSILTKRYYKSSQDTNYVVRPEGRLTLKLSANQSGNSLRARGTQNDVPIKSHLTTRHKTTISIGAAYRGISLSYSINPAKLAGLYKDYELNINFYSKRFCLNANYQRSSSLSGNIYYGDDTYRMNSGDTEMKVWNITAYYIFNHRRFSIAAPFSQSYIQRRSAGSWLAGISYQGGKVKPTDELKENHPEFRDVRLSIGHIGIGGGCLAWSVSMGRGAGDASSPRFMQIYGGDCIITYK